jgi:hypothetical protein
MLTREKPPVITAAKINHRGRILHPFERFVAAETVAFMFGLPAEEIYRIDCWRYVVYVHGKGISRFVSYADFPPTIGVERLEMRDFKRWERRWYNRSKVRKAPNFWVQYYCDRLQKTTSIDQLEEWWETIDQFEAQWTETARQELQACYQLVNIMVAKNSFNSMGLDTSITNN